MGNLNLSQHLYTEEFGEDVGNKDAANVNPIDDDLKKVERIQSTLVTRMQPISI